MPKGGQVFDPPCNGHAAGIPFRSLIAHRTAIGLLPYWQTRDSSITLYCGNAVEVLRRLPARSVHCVVTSPPYWGFRDYGHEDQLGSESTADEFIGNLVTVFTELRRVLRNDGTLWLNMGDSYGVGQGDTGVFTQGRTDG